jgi:hypothetical protein
MFGVILLKIRTFPKRYARPDLAVRTGGVRVETAMVRRSGIQPFSTTGSSQCQGLARKNGVIPRGKA